MQAGEEIIFRGDGISRLDGGRTGNLILKIAIEIPTRLSADQKKLYEAILLSE